MKNNIMSVALAGALAMAGGALAGDFSMEASVMVGDVPTIRSVEEFREPLAQHGTWFQVASYGRVWQPDVVRVEHGWRPYCHGGNWVWTDRGWFWSSTYAWGWAPFHYGRWACLPVYGWVWVPDLTWGPAWVEWRSSDEYVGWAPSCPVVSSGLTIGYSSGNMSFSYTIADDTYCYVPAPRFAEVQVVTYLVPYREDHRYRCEPPSRHGRHGRHGDGDRDGDRDGRDRDRYEMPRSAPPASEGPRFVNTESGRRPDRVQPLYGRPPLVPVRPSPAVTRPPSVVRPQGPGTRPEALLAQMNRNPPVRSPAPVRGVSAAGKPVTEMMARRNISPEQLRAALERAGNSPRYSKMAEVVRERWAAER